MKKITKKEFIDTLCNHESIQCGLLCHDLDESQKDSLGSDIIIAVTNLLPKQAFSLLQKDNKLTIQQENELEAIVALLNAQQIQTIEKMINSVPNGGLKKSMSKRLKNMVS